jgi:hypothetical protein
MSDIDRFSLRILAAFPIADKVSNRCGRMALPFRHANALQLAPS